MASNDEDEYELAYYEEINDDEIVVYVNEDISDIEFYVDEDGKITEDMELEQEGGGGGGQDGFTIQSVNERHIQKFNVRGFEYKVTLQDMTNLSYLEAVQTLHHRLNRKYNNFYFKVCVYDMSKFLIICFSCRTDAKPAGYSTTSRHGSSHHQFAWSRS
jgi:hypothetical protein